VNWPVTCRAWHQLSRVCTVCVGCLQQWTGQWLVVHDTSSAVRWYSASDSSSSIQWARGWRCETSVWQHSMGWCDDWRWWQCHCATSKQAWSADWTWATAQSLLVDMQLFVILLMFLLSAELPTKAFCFCVRTIHLIVSGCVPQLGSVLLHTAVVSSFYCPCG